MRSLYPVSLFLVAAISASAAGAVDSSRFSVEVGFRLGNYLGGITDEDGKYYRNIGFGLIDDKGNHAAMDPQGTSLAFEVGGFLPLVRNLSAGPVFQYQSVSEGSSKPMKDDHETDLLDAKFLLAKVRWEPIILPNSRLGLEGGIGIGFGTLRRFGMAVRNLDMIRADLQENAVKYNLDARTIENILSYATEGNEPLDVVGLHWDLGFRAVLPVRYGFGFTAKLGIESTQWWLPDDDPLDRRVDAYPKSISGFGVEIGVGALKSF